MNQPATINPYLRNQVLSASPEQLRLMLYDGALRFMRAGKLGLAEQNFDTSYTNLSKAQKIIIELSNSLKPQIMPDLCEKLSALYTYIYRLLIDANMQRTTQPVDEAITLLEFERETWVMMMEKNAAANGAA
ncbi:MAG: flagellar export chaperone FliS [Planctomycetota bacterium]